MGCTLTVPDSPKKTKNTSKPELNENSSGIRTIDVYTNGRRISTEHYNSINTTENNTLTNTTEENSDNNESVNKLHLQNPTITKETIEENNNNDNNDYLLPPSTLNHAKSTHTPPHSYYYHHKPNSKNNVLFSNTHTQKLERSYTLPPLQSFPKIQPQHKNKTQSLASIELENDHVITHSTAIDESIRKFNSSLLLSSFSSPILKNTSSKQKFSRGGMNSNSFRRKSDMARNAIRIIPPFGRIKRSKSAPSIMIPKSKNLEFKRINAYASNSTLITVH